MPRDDVQECLQGLAPAAMRKLSASEHQRLRDLVERARGQRGAEHAAAIDAAVSQVPAMLRSTLRRMLAE